MPGRGTERYGGGAGFDTPSRASSVRGVSMTRLGDRKHFVMLSR